MSTTRPLKKKKTNWLLRLITFFIGLAIAGAAIIAVMVIVVYPRLPSMDDLRNYQPKLPLQIYSDDGILIGQFGEERRIYLSFDNTPKMLVNAILSAEDERFYQHHGIDYLGVLRALFLNVVSGHKQSGASTITMQVARNFFLSSKKTYGRKFNEVLLATKIENSLSKDQILELYINQIYLGQRSYGFAEAALTYFGKPIDQLSIAQYAVLAGLPKAPSAYNPVVNKKRSRQRQIYVLGRMRDNGYITPQQYEEAINQDISVVKGTKQDATDAGGYISEMVRQMLYDKYGDKIYTDGYKVNTTINSKMQFAAYNSLRNGLLQFDMSKGYNGAEDYIDIEDSDDDDLVIEQVLSQAFDGLTDFGDIKAAIVTKKSKDSITVRIRDGNEYTFSGKELDFVKKYLNDSGKKGIKRGSVVRVRVQNDGKPMLTQMPKVEGALVALDPNNGAIRSLAGGFDFTNNKFNHVTQANRQPGSGFKPFIYSAALEKGFTPNTIISDSEICFASGGDNGSGWCPRNDDNSFLGEISMRQALTFSRNVVTVKILNQISPQFAMDYVTKFGFNKSQFQPYLTMALGANEVTPMQMAQAYAVFANGGYMVEPYLIKNITDDKGNILAQTTPVDIHKAGTTIDPRNAYIMNSILQDVVRYGTGARAYRELRRNDIAGKTGTTTDSKDVWFDGYTPNLVAITWVGYDQPKSLGSHVFGSTLALPIWINFMKDALNGVPERSLSMPAGIDVLHNETWKGNDEYIYAGSSPLSGLDKDTSEESNEEEHTEEDKNSSDTDSSSDDLINQVANQAEHHEDSSAVSKSNQNLDNIQD